jgi:hypothetical protein
MIRGGRVGSAVDAGAGSVRTRAAATRALGSHDMPFAHACPRAVRRVLQDEPARSAAGRTRVDVVEPDTSCNRSAPLNGHDLSV